MHKPPHLRTSLADLSRQESLLRLEYEYEKEEFRRQTETVGIAHKTEQGLCWFPVAVQRNYYNSLNQLAVEITRREEKETEHSFESGRPVCFFTQSATRDISYLHFTAQVSYVQEDRMVVILPHTAARDQLATASSLGVQLYFDETTYRALFQALSDVQQARDNRLAELREILSGHAAPAQRELYPVRFPWLNPSQEQAVNRVLCARDVAVVHGPPGTGKTTTLVEAIYETLHRENQVLVCAQSNTAVDWISEKLTDRGIPVLRIGNPSRVNDKMLSFTYERLFENHPAYNELWSIRKSIREIQEQLRRQEGKNRESVRNRLHHLRDRTTEIEFRIHEDLFTQSRVIACTLTGSNHRLLFNRHFSTLFIDEAAQALEAACWIAIRKADRVIFAGDHCQLPPTVKCIEATRQGLGTTLLEKVVARKPAAVSLLTIQYRMHEDIMRFPSDYFYQGKLQAAPEVRFRGILDYDTPLVWIDTSSAELRERVSGERFGRINTDEADLLLREVETYIRQIGENRIQQEQIDFGLISPYRAQVHYLKSRFWKSHFFRPFHKLVTIHTVDGFQEQERDVVFISLVRSNAEGQIGFLSDIRRINVAITRARMKLVLLGDAQTLGRHPFYRELLRHIGTYGNLREVSLPREEDAAED
ncbi:MAG: AAA domain-containing protein [Bacteroides sp.]|nr:AAA domain-containing protein [Bacteroides sp.]